MDEKTLLAEKAKEEKKESDAVNKTLEKIEKKYVELKENNRQEQEKQFETIKKSSQYTINPFSASAFKDVETIEKSSDMQPSKTATAEQKSSADNSLIIETPNYDMIETLSPEQRKKIFKIEENVKTESEAKAKPNRFKIIMFSILFAIFGIWGIVNIAMLDNISSSLSEITAEYNMNLASYLNNLHTLDGTSAENMENLFETIPKDDFPPNSIGEQSNWFDRFCNFISGLFGG